MSLSTETSRPSSPESVPALRLVAARTPLEGVRVLVVDDQEDAREALRLVLQAEGAFVTTADSGATALTQLSDERPDVMVVDLGMPQVDGFTLVEQLRRRPEETGGAVPAAALTGYVSGEDRLRAARAGFQAYLVKPVEVSELVATLRTLAGRT